MNKILLLIGIFVAFNLNAQDYRPVPGKMMTKWGEAITPENAWKEYPRPQLKRDAWQNLNGLWDYVIVNKESDQPNNFQANILVPFAVESALSGVGKTSIAG